MFGERRCGTAYRVAHQPLYPPHREKVLVHSQMRLVGCDGGAPIVKIAELYTPDIHAGRIKFLKHADKLFARGVKDENDDRTGFYTHKFAKRQRNFGFC